MGNITVYRGNNTQINYSELCLTSTTNDNTDYSDENVIKKFLYEYSYSYFGKIPVTEYNINNLLVNGIDVKSFYCVFIIGSVEQPVDISFLTFNKVSLHFFRPTSESCFDTFKLILDYIGEFDKFKSKYNMDFIIRHSCFYKYLNENCRVDKIININTPHNMKFKVFKLDPDKLFTEYNINLFKVRELSSI